MASCKKTLKLNAGQTGGNEINCSESVNKNISLKTIKDSPNEAPCEKRSNNEEKMEIDILNNKENKIKEIIEID